MFSVHERLVLDNAPSMHQIECFLRYVLNCMCVSCGDHGFSFLRCPHFYHCFLGGTVGCHRDCIQSCYSCVIFAELQAETEGYANC